MNASWQHFALGGALAGLVVGLVVFGGGLLPRPELVLDQAEPGEVHALEVARGAEPLPAEEMGPSAAAVASAGEQHEPVPVASNTARGSWRKLASAGHFSRAYEAALADGFEAECESASAADLLLLADAARLSAHPAQAFQAYGVARRRFAGSDEAGRAAFALGRLAFDSGDHAAAMLWFESYLAEKPSGALAPAAFDRLLESALRAGDSAQTRAIAERYLVRYPKGAYADKARRLAGL